MLQKTCSSLAALILCSVTAPAVFQSLSIFLCNIVDINTSNWSCIDAWNNADFRIGRFSDV